MSLLSKFEILPPVGRALLIIGFAVLGFKPSTGFAQTAPFCGPEVKLEIIKALASVENASDAQKLAVQQEIYQKYQYCNQDAKNVPATFFAAARECGAEVSNLGSLLFEEMSCSG